MSARRDDLKILAGLIGDEDVLSDPAARLVYSHDASHITKGLPLAVVLPPDAVSVGEVLRRCAESGIPVVSRGTGTGLSGGAVPGDGEIVLSAARLVHLGPVDSTGRRVRVGAGTLNDQVSAHAAPYGLHFAPDPSSQSASSIGGNIAENAGGPHCLRHGVTLRHVRRLEYCDAQGRTWTTGRGVSCERGIDLTMLLCGSEGTLGVVTAADLNLEPNPEAVVTLAAFFPDLNDATGSVVALLGAGLLPVAVEMIDRTMLEAVEEAFGFGFPIDVDAAMILEFAGAADEIAVDSSRARALLNDRGAREIRRAEDETTRLELWKCRKKAFGAVGRLAPSYVTMDVVVPLGRLPGLVREIQKIKARHGVQIGTAFHAGDGNLHPGVHYDDRDPEEMRKAHAAADEIIRAALERGGSITGEHGIGLEKLHAAPWQLEPVALEMMWGIKKAFDPGGLLNPGKALPPVDAECAPPKPAPTGCRFDWDSLTVTAAADVKLADVQSEALTRGLWLPTGIDGERTIGSLVDHALLRPLLLATGSPRDYLLEVWAEAGDSRLLHAGAPVFKNVAGYQLPHLLCGSGGVLAETRAASFQLRPAPQQVTCWSFARRDAGQDLSAVANLLAECDSVRGAPVMLGDAKELWILVAGRDEDGDPGRLAGRLEDLLGAAQETWTAASREIRSGSEWLPDWVPDWMTQAPVWTAAAARPSESGDSPLLPAVLPNRWLWQSAPRLIWIPDEFPEPSGWHTDVCCRAGLPTSLPEPGDGVPRRLLRDLKYLFDPDGRLPAPAWLDGGGDD